MSYAPSAAFPSVLAPALAGELTPSSPIRCIALTAIIPARCCVLRQQAAAVQRTQQTYRGTASEFPSCLRCAQGRAIQEALGAVRGDVAGGARGGFHRQVRRRQHDRAGQEAARERLRLVGALDPVPSQDEPPPEPDEASAAL